jgi:WD40 repeat protein
VALTQVDTTTGAQTHVWPVATPDPDVVVFTIWSGTLASSKLAAATLPGGHVTPLDLSGIRPLAVLDGHLIYVQADGSVMAVPFDVRRQRVTGAPLPVHNPVGVDRAVNGNSEIYVSNGGSLITGTANSTAQLVWLSPDGTTRPAIPGVRHYDWLALSPDGHRIAAVVSDGQGSDVWIWDGALSTFSRQTTAGTVASVAWTSDGSKIVYVSPDSAGKPAVWSQPVTGGSPPRELFAGPDIIVQAVLTPDGKSLVLQAFHNSWDLMRVPLDSTPVSRPYVADRFNAIQPNISPDGRWVAYASDETGQMEVYVRSFPDPSRKMQVSTGRGSLAAWSADGGRLYYVSSTGSHSMLVDARLRLSPTLSLLGRDTVRSLAGFTGPTYAVSPDGAQVLAVKPVSAGYRIVVSPNWGTELKERLAASGGGGGKK